MPSDLPDLPNFERLQRLGHDDLNKIVKALRGVIHDFVDNFGTTGDDQENRPAVTENWIGRTAASLVSSSDPACPAGMYYVNKWYSGGPGTDGKSAPVMPTFYRDQCFEQGVAAINLAELDITGAGMITGLLATGTSVHVFAIASRDANGSAMYFFDRAPPAIFPVDLTQTGGAAGSVSALCSYTYTMKPAGATNTLGTALAPLASFARAFKCTATAATQGIGSMRGGSATIEVAFETTGVKDCT